MSPWKAVTTLKTHQLRVVVALGSLLAACGNSSSGGMDAEAGSGPSGAGASALAGAGPTGSAGSSGGDTSVPSAGADQGGASGAAAGGVAGTGEAGGAQGGTSGGTPGMAGSAGAPGPDPSKPPGQNFDLSRFTLQLPTDVNDPGKSVDQIKAADLVNYSSIYFQTDKADSSMVFWCPENGAHTGNTHYPRTELRENAIGGDWQITATATLSATFKVTKLAAGATIIGQIHGNKTDGTSEALKLEYNTDNSITAVFEKNAAPSSEDPQALGKYSLGEKLSYEIALANRTITVTITSSKGVKKTASTSYTASSWTGDTYYFKLGDYVQATSSSSTNGARVAFYAFNIEHK